MKIVDAENLNPIKNARILKDNKVYYTNDDGLVLIPEKFQNFEVSAPNYQNQKIENYTSEIRLKPFYKTIDEIKMVNVNIKDIFENVLKNYAKIYYDQPSLYDIVYKQKNYYDNKLNFLVIADGKLWTKTNQYNYKEGFRKNFDNILQLQLNNIRYLKKTNRDSLFSGRTNEFSHEIIGNYFFNYELSRLIGALKAADKKIFGTVVSQEGYNQFINFKISKKNGTAISGNFTYNTSNGGMSRFEVTYDQSDFPIMKKKAADGKEYDYKMGIASLMFDFYLKDGKYIPSRYNFKGDNFLMIMDNKTLTRKFEKQIIYNVFTPSNNDGLDSKIDFTKDFWDNIPTNDKKTDPLLLSEEEANFLNVSTDEK
ncbi:hypothetical protein [Chryseobacterium camelliae]|uniref:hypothetical protein n=1 Tax=Chryseobacterium camelliae TaxID=1265445 RepID=UPI0012FD2814|nr:hypothetical protein [Chryseobacterium camelliae]